MPEMEDENDEGTVEDEQMPKSQGVEKKDKKKSDKKRRKKSSDKHKDKRKDRKKDRNKDKERGRSRSRRRGRFVIAGIWKAFPRQNSDGCLLL